MIGSGKSTYCNAMAKLGSIVINDDAIVTAVHGGNYNLYDIDLKPVYKGIEHHIINLAASMRRNIIIDRPCFLRSTRSRYIELAKSYDIDVRGIIFDKSPAQIHAKRRFDSDNRGHDLDYWLRVAKVHESLWEEPHKGEGYTELLKYDWNDGSLQPARMA